MAKTKIFITTSFLYQKLFMYSSKDYMLLTILVIDIKYFILEDGLPNIHKNTNGVFMYK